MLTLASRERLRSLGSRLQRRAVRGGAAAIRQRTSSPGLSFTQGQTHYHSSFAWAMLASSAVTRDCA